MITDLLINLILTPIQLLLDQLPTAASLGLNSDASTIVSALPPLGWLNDYMPVTQMIEAAIAIVACLAIMLLVNFGLWVYHQFPTVGGGNG